jgi:hypothetical protein
MRMCIAAPRSDYCRRALRGARGRGSPPRARGSTRASGRGETRPSIPRRSGVGSARHVLGAPRVATRPESVSVHAGPPASSDGRRGSSRRARLISRIEVARDPRGVEQQQRPALARGEPRRGKDPRETRVGWHSVARRPRRRAPAPPRPLRRAASARAPATCRAMLRAVPRASGRDVRRARQPLVRPEVVTSSGSRSIFAGPSSRNAVALLGRTKLRWASAAAADGPTRVTRGSRSSHPPPLQRNPVLPVCERRPCGRARRGYGPGAPTARTLPATWPRNLPPRPGHARVQPAGDAETGRSAASLVDARRYRRSGEIGGPVRRQCDERTRPLTSSACSRGPR